MIFNKCKCVIYPSKDPKIVFRRKRPCGKNISDYDMVLESTSFIRHKGLNFDHMKLMVNSDALNMNSLFDSEPVGF